MHRRVVLLLATALVAPAATMAQVPSTRNALGLDSVAFAALRARVTSQDNVRVRGTFGELVIRRPTLTADSLLAGADSSGTPGPRVSLRDVNRIQVRGSAAGTGAAVGAGVGFAGGLLVGLGLSAALCGEGGCNSEASGVTVITFGSTAGGALLGTLVGAPLKKWHTVYRAR